MPRFVPRITAKVALPARSGRVQSRKRRARLCELLWDVADDPRAALRWSLSKLRELVDGEGRQRLLADREDAAVGAVYQRCWSRRWPPSWRAAGGARAA
jgi:hypothetical protein